MKVIITGSSGMVGKGVLLECLESDKITQVLVINRKSSEIKNPKLKELIIKDFFTIADYNNQLSGYDGCFYCLGISSVGMNELEYSRITHDLTNRFVDVLHLLNPKMIFNYVSGTNTDSTEQGKIMWARVKGKTENMVLKKGFKDAYMFRPGVIIPEKGITSSTSWYQILYVISRPIYPLLKNIKSITTTTKLGLAMISTLFQSQEIKLLEGKDINDMASK